MWAITVKDALTGKGISGCEVFYSDAAGEKVSGSSAKTNSSGYAILSPNNLRRSYITAKHENYLFKAQETKGETIGTMAFQLNKRYSQEMGKGGGSGDPTASSLSTSAISGDNSMVFFIIIAAILIILFLYSLSQR